MEIKRTICNSRHWVCFCLWAFLVLIASASGQAQEYTVRDGKQYISSTPGKNEAALEKFIRQYDLTDIGLRHFIRTGKPDSLTAAGWRVEQNSSSGFIISKPLLAAADVQHPADRIDVWSHSTKGDLQFPAVSSTVRYGYNRFRNTLPFPVNKDSVRFFLRGYKNAKTVSLSGSFNDWSTQGLKMTKLEDGWVATVSMAPGKYWYKFIVDGDWKLDQDNRLRESDNEGNINSIYYCPNTVFTLHGHEKARKVYLAGSFNNWRPSELQLVKTPVGWELPIYLANGTHTYKFVVDGRWLEDDRQKERLPDGQGGYNSVYRIGKNTLFALKGFANAKNVVLSGSFNDWREDELVMQRTFTGWEIPYTLDAGNYEYKFKVDGAWVTDPSNPLTVERDGIKNSYLIIGANYTFRLKGYAAAKNVFVAGTFNNWSPTTHAMSRIGNEWTFSVHLPPGKHLYKFIVDGKWIIDPGNKLWEGNKFDTGNSVLWKE